MSLVFDNKRHVYLRVYTKYCLEIDSICQYTLTSPCLTTCVIHVSAFLLINIFK